MDRLAADFEGPAAHSTQRLKERNFLASGRAYVARLALTLPEPKIVCRTDASAPDSILAAYDLKTGEYVVNPSKLETPGQPLVAERQDVDRGVSAQYGWIASGGPGIDADQSLLKLFKAVEQWAGAASARRLAVAILESFDRNWRTANAGEQVAAVNAKVKAVPDVDLQDALQYL